MGAAKGDSGEKLRRRDASVPRRPGGLFFDRGRFLLVDPFTPSYQTDEISGSLTQGNVFGFDCHKVESDGSHGEFINRREVTDRGLDFQGSGSGRGMVGFG